MNNERKCDKFEAYFTFSSEEEFLNHVKNCPDCQKEYDEQMKISKLIKETAPAYLKRQSKKKTAALKRLACCFVFFIGLTAFTGYNMYSNSLVQDTSDESYITSIGLPTDDYGFLEI